MCMRSCAYWRRSCCGHWGRDVQTPFLSVRPVTLRLNYWWPKRVSRLQMSSANAAENLISSSQIFRCVKGEKEIKHLFNSACPSLTPERKRRGEKRQKIIDKGCSISDPSFSLGTALLRCWAGFAGLSKCCLITVIQDHLLKASICLSLRWEMEKSLKREGMTSNLPNSSDIDPLC